MLLKEVLYRLSPLSNPIEGCDFSFSHFPLPLVSFGSAFCFLICPIFSPGAQAWEQNSEMPFRTGQSHKSGPSWSPHLPALLWTLCLLLTPAFFSIHIWNSLYARFSVSRLPQEPSLFSHLAVTSRKIYPRHIFLNPSSALTPHLQSGECRILYQTGRTMASPPEMLCFLCVVLTPDSISQGDDHFPPLFFISASPDFADFSLDLCTLSLPQTGLGRAASIPSQWPPLVLQLCYSRTPTMEMLDFFLH